MKKELLNLYITVIIGALLTLFFYFNSYTSKLNIILNVLSFALFVYGIKEIRRYRRK